MKKKELVIDVQKDIRDPQKFPWPLKTESVSSLTCLNVFEYVPGKLRGKFMDEVYRVLVPKGSATFAVKYWNSAEATQDYACEWPPISERSFLYFNKGWREANGLKRPLTCDFDFTYGYSVDPDTASRSDETRSFHLKYYVNVVSLLQVVLTKR